MTALASTRDVPPGVLLGGTDEACLAAEADAARPLLVAEPRHHADTGAAVRGTLAAALAALPAAGRATAAVLMLAGAYSTWAARRFSHRTDDTRRRLRPSDSIRLETSELIRTVARETGWRGPCFQLAALPAERALPMARALVAGPHPSLILCELSLLDPHDLAEPGCLVVAAVWPPPPGDGAPATAEPPQPTTSRLLAALAAPAPTSSQDSREWTGAA